MPPMLHAESPLHMHATLGHRLTAAEPGVTRQGPHRPRRGARMARADVLPDLVHQLILRQHLQALHKAFIRVTGSPSKASLIQGLKD